MKITSEFRSKIVGAFPEGAAWLDSLPSLLQAAERKWAIEVGAPFSLSFNYVAQAITRAGQPVVLKVGVPNHELKTEIATLQAYAGSGAVRLLECDPARGMLLLERVLPGEPLATIADDAEATRIAARLMRQLWRPLPQGHSFPTLGEWAAGLRSLRTRFAGEAGPLPARLVELAVAFFAELLGDAGPPMLLHGDLHHENILSSERAGWLAIDPKGLAGEPSYDTAALLENPTPDRYLNVETQRTRVAILTEELGLDAQRVIRYGVAHCVLSAWWSLEDSDDNWTQPCACAEVLTKLLT